MKAGLLFSFNPPNRMWVFFREPRSPAVTIPVQLLESKWDWLARRTDSRTRCGSENQKRVPPFRNHRAIGLD